MADRTTRTQMRQRTQIRPAPRNPRFESLFLDLLGDPVPRSVYIMNVHDREGGIVQVSPQDADGMDPFPAYALRGVRADPGDLALAIRQVDRAGGETWYVVNTIARADESMQTGQMEPFIVPFGATDDPVSTTNVGTLARYVAWSGYMGVYGTGTYRVYLTATGVMSRSADTGGMRFRLSIQHLTEPIEHGVGEQIIRSTNFNISSRTQMTATVSADITFDDASTNDAFFNAVLDFTGLDTAATTTLSYASISGWFQKIA